VSDAPSDELTELAIHLADLLAKYHRRLVLAESCTGGLVAATLAGVPGISNHFCGSAVTYRDATKVSWLSVDAPTIASQTSVCQDVAQMMAVGVLAKTNEADLAASVTGHLGPNAPLGMDGLIYVGIADRTKLVLFSAKLQTAGRHNRQREATVFVFQKTIAYLTINGGIDDAFSSEQRGSPTSTDF
jgi:nicotinamide-nucleotide amidase